MKKILPLFSYVLHPIFVPILGTLLYFLHTETYLAIEQKALLVIQVMILTFFIPICFFLLLRAMSKADSIMLPSATQRKLPLLLQLLFTGILLWKSVPKDALSPLYYFFFAGMVSLMLALLFLFAEIKVSLHLIGISSLTVFAIGLSVHNQINTLYEIAGLVFLIGLVAASRIEMKAHDAKEIVLGFLAGIVPQLLLFRLWL